MTSTSIIALWSQRLHRRNIVEYLMACQFLQLLQQCVGRSEPRIRKSGVLRHDGNDRLIFLRQPFSNAVSAFSCVQKEPHRAKPIRSVLIK